MFYFNWSLTLETKSCSCFFSDAPPKIIFICITQSLARNEFYCDNYDSKVIGYSFVIIFLRNAFWYIKWFWESDQVFNVTIKCIWLPNFEKLIENNIIQETVRKYPNQAFNFPWTWTEFSKPLFLLKLRVQVFLLFLLFKAWNDSLTTDQSTSVGQGVDFVFPRSQ